MRPHFTNRKCRVISEETATVRAQNVQAKPRYSLWPSRSREVQRIDEFVYGMEQAVLRQ